MFKVSEEQVNTELFAAQTALWCEEYTVPCDIERIERLKGIKDALNWLQGIRPESPLEMMDKEC